MQQQPVSQEIQSFQSRLAEWFIGHNKFNKHHAIFKRPCFPTKFQRVAIDDLSEKRLNEFISAKKTLSLYQSREGIRFPFVRFSYDNVDSFKCRSWWFELTDDGAFEIDVLEYGQDEHLRCLEYENPGMLPWLVGGCQPMLNATILNASNLAKKN